MARQRPKGDPVNGILLLDKHQGVTSNGALQEVKRLMQARKAGHTGSLDPLATGLLPVCFGEATKLSSFFLEADKTYQTTVRLGQTTDTGDSEGEIIHSRAITSTQEDVLDALSHFRGEIDQVPPVYSALKVNGQPMYKLARKGIAFERPARRVCVHDIKLTDAGDEWLAIEIRCSSGFYVRSLAHDVGEMLGCGAHVATLRRTAVGEFGADDMVACDTLANIESIEERRGWLRSPDHGLSHIPLVNLSVDAAFYLCRGQTVTAADLPEDLPKAAWVRLYCEAAGFLGMGTIQDDGRVAPKRLFQLA